MGFGRQMHYNSSGSLRKGWNEFRFLKTRHGGQAQTEAENRGERIGEFRFVKTQTEAEFVRIRHSGQA